MKNGQGTLLLVFLLFAGTAGAQSRVPESLERWPKYVEVNLPEGGPGVCDFLASGAVYTYAGRADFGDLRLIDGARREVPFAIRHRSVRREFRSLPAKEFNRVTLPDRSVELSLDLGAGAAEHNRAEITASGINFRRSVRIDGSDDGKEWRKLVTNAPIMYFTAAGQTLDARAVTYPASRFRYLRVTASPDSGIANDRPTDMHVTVTREVTDPGSWVTWPVVMSEREPGRSFEGYSSEWTLSLPGSERMPWEKLEFAAPETDFVRAFRLEEVVPSGPARMLASGQWERTKSQSGKLQIDLPDRVVASKVRLIVIDQRNPPLSLSLVFAQSPADQFVFPRTAEMTGPLHLYLGNASASPPGYDIDLTLPPVPEVAQRATMGSVHDNSDYRATTPPVPFLDRHAWITPVAFGIVAAVLLGLLLLMARESVRRHDAIGGTTTAA